MIKQGQANWVKPDLNRFGPVDFYTDNITAHGVSATPARHRVVERAGRQAAASCATPVPEPVLHHPPTRCTDRTDTAQGWFKHYMIGLEGLCSVYTPSVSYWCSQHLGSRIVLG